MRASAARCVGVGGDAVGVLNRAAVASVRLGRPWPNATVCTISFFDIFFIVGQKRGGGFYFVCRISKKWNKYISWLIRQDGT